MSKYTNYRIIEKDNYYIQQKRKYTGWGTIYDGEKTLGVQIICGLVTIIFLLAFVICWCVGAKVPITLYFIPAVAVFVGFTGRLLFKINFRSIEQAKSFIEERVRTNETYLKDKQEKKEKRKNSKIHYMDLESQRKDKLSKLSKK